jgi:hypothetical protein
MPAKHRDVGKEIDRAKPSPEVARRVERDLDQHANDPDRQLGNETAGGAHWPLDLEEHLNSNEGAATQEPLKRSQHDEEKLSPGS